MAINDDKALIASSDFDPTQFSQGIDTMIGGLDKVIAKEGELNAQISAQQKLLNVTNIALKQTNDQIAALDKTSSSYNQSLTKLTTQQQQLQQQQASQNATMKTQNDQLVQTAAQADKFKTALTGITQAAAQVKASGGDIFNIASLTAQLNQVNQVAAEFRNIFQGKIDTTELDELEQRLAGTGDEFEKLRDIVGFVQEKLSTLDPNTQEFRDLNEVVTTGTKVLEEFDKVSGNVGSQGETVRKRLQALRNEMASLQEQGQEDTDIFKSLQTEAAELQDALDKTGERIRTFSNDFRLIEGAVEGLRGFAAGFELVEGASALFGVKNEAVEESIKRLNAIMAIANGLQEVSNLLKKESVLRLVGEELATKTYIVTQRVLAATLGSTAAASRGLATALAATGIGALIIGIGLLVAALNTLTEKTEDQEKAQERLNETNEIGIEFNNRYIAGIESNTRLFEAEAQARQTANEKIRQSDLEKTRNQAANNAQLRTIQTKGLEEQLEQARKEEEAQSAGAERAATLRRNAVTETNKVLFQLRTAFGREPTEQEIVNANSEKLIPELEKTIADYDKVVETRINLEKALDLKRVQNQKDAAKESTDVRRAELAELEDFIKRVGDLRRRLTDAQNRQARQDGEQITKTAQDNLTKELNAIQRDVRLKNLTQDRANQLKVLAKQVSGVELTTSLRDFEKKSVAAQQSIEDQLLQLRLQSGETRANLLRDQLEQEAATITQEYRKEFVSLEDARRTALQGVQDAFDQGLISEGQFKRNSDRIKELYVQLFDDLELTTSRKREELGRIAFQQGSALLQQLFADSGATLTEHTNQQIIELTAKYTGGTIRYETYQRRLTQILQTESKKRIDQEIAEANELLAGTQRRLAAEQDPQQRKTLEDQIIALREQIAQLLRQKSEAEATATKTTDDNFKADVNRFAQYAAAIGGVVDQVVKFWQLANEAEQKSLEKSIALQEQRVDAATRIAERGNAEYLRLEEDRLTELQVKQENAARRQLAINAVVQASQALVAFTTALAQGIATGGPLGGIAIAAAVLGVIASGYAIIQSLQSQNQQTVKLYKGKRRVSRDNGEPAGIDTVPAMLTEGETVISKPVADAYAPTLDAIFGNQINPESLNRFVQDSRVGRRQLATLSSDRIAEAHEVQASYDARLIEASQAQTRQLQQANEQLGALHEAMKESGTSITFNQKGFAVALKGALRRMDINKKV